MSSAGEDGPEPEAPRYGEPAGPRLVGSGPEAAAAGLTVHLWVPLMAEAQQIGSDHRELEQLRKEVHTLQDRLSGSPTFYLLCFPIPHLEG